MPQLAVKGEEIAGGISTERFLRRAAGGALPNPRRAPVSHDLFEAAAILIAREAPGDERVRGLEEERRGFGFRWFLPDPGKHKPIWRDVLIASLAIQLIGL